MVRTAATNRWLVMGGTWSNAQGQPPGERVGTRDIPSLTTNRKT